MAGRVKLKGKNTSTNTKSGAFKLSISVGAYQSVRENIRHETSDSGTYVVYTST